MSAAALAAAAAVPAPGPRWFAVIVYRSDGGPVYASHDLDEVEDLHDIVELGPDWDTIERIEIVRAGGSTLTLEAAEAL